MFLLLKYIYIILLLIKNINKELYLHEKKIELWNMKYFFKFDLIPILFILICIIIIILINRNI